MLLYPFSCSRRKNLRNLSKEGCMELFIMGPDAMDYTDGSTAKRSLHSEARKEREVF